MGQKCKDLFVHPPIWFAQKQFRTSQLKKTNYAEDTWYLDSVVHHTVLCRSYFPSTVLRHLSEEYASVDPHRWLAEQCPQGSQSLSTPSTVHLLTLQHGLLMLLFNIYYFGNNQISKGKFLSSCQTMYAEREHLYLDSVVHHTVLCRSYFPNTVLRRLSEEYMPGSASVDPHRWLNNVPKVPSLSAHHQLYSQKCKG